MSTVAILGLGAMGRRMAANLLLAGHVVRVWNRSPVPFAEVVALGATGHATPREAARQAEFVISMLRDDDASRAVWLDAATGALAGLQPDAVAIECGTTSVAWCGELAERVCVHGACFLDAPVVGSRPQAEAKALIHLIGGPQDLVDRSRPVLEASASAIHRVGDTGSGMAMKLAVNALFGIQVAALGELLNFVAHYGIDVHQAAELFGQLPVTSPVAKVAAAAIADRRYAPLFPVALADKDFRYTLESARMRGALLPTTAAVGDLFQRAIRAGHGEQNLYAVAELFN